MFNPIRYIKDLIDILRDPPGEAVAACRISVENIDHIYAAVIESYGPSANKYVKLGDYYLEMVNGSTIVPATEFFKHFAFDIEPQDDVSLFPVRTIKPI